MIKHDDPFHLQITLPIIVAFTVCIGIFLSFYTHDPHWLNRAGALIAALAAAAILLQISAEISLEDERGVIERKATDTKDTASLGPLDDLEGRLILKRLEVQQDEITRRRLHIASYVISMAMLGEILHGFGDLLMCHAFGVCSLH